MLLGFAGTALFSAIAALVGVLLSVLDLIDLEGKLPTPVVAAVGGVGFVAGAMGGALLVRALYYRPRLNSVRKERDKARDASRRHEAYAKHIHLLLMELHGNGIASEEDSLLLEPAQIMEQAIGTKIRLSVWAQAQDHTSLGKPKWTIECAPDHTDRQCHDFAVPVKDSWISFMENLKRNSEGNKHGSKDFVFGLPDLTNTSSEGNDLKAFIEYGFESLRCTSVPSGDGQSTDADETRCLVALAEEPDVFDETEDWYIIFLGQILGLHRRMSEPAAGR